MKDFSRNEGDLRIENGDLVVGDSLSQHQEDIVYFDKGWNHFVPTLGVGVQRYLNDVESVVGIAAVIRVELERDGQVVEKVSLQKGKIAIQAIYE